MSVTGIIGARGEPRNSIGQHDGKWVLSMRYSCKEISAFPAIRAPIAKGGVGPSFVIAKQQVCFYSTEKATKTSTVKYRRNGKKLIPKQTLLD